MVSVLVNMQIMQCLLRLPSVRLIQRIRICPPLAKEVALIDISLSLSGDAVAGGGEATEDEEEEQKGRDDHSEFDLQVGGSRNQEYCSFGNCSVIVPDTNSCMHCTLFG